MDGRPDAKAMTVSRMTCDAVHSAQRAIVSWVARPTARNRMDGMVRGAVSVLLAVSVALAVTPRAVRSQGRQNEHGQQVSPKPAASPAADAAAAGATEAMSGATSAMGDPGSAIHMSHMRWTPARSATSSDSARALKVVGELRRGIARYRDVKAAERDGFRMFAPELRNQQVYHFTNYRQAFREHFRFDPTKPASLLYRRDPDGKFVLMGGMYVAPKRADVRDLDARVPTSLARWHAHVNVCVPRRGERERWKETEGGVMRFGPAGAITTREACDQAKGRFHEQLFGWMVHVNAFGGESLGGMFADEHLAHGARQHKHE